MRFIKLKEVMEKTSLSRSSIYQKIKEKEFPAQIKTTDHSTAWVEDEVNKWMKDRADMRPKAGGLSCALLVRQFPIFNEQTICLN